MRRIAPRSAFVLASALVLAAGCRDKSPAPADSSLSQDLALAQRANPQPTVFNDAPVGTTAPASPAPAAPVKQPEPPRAKAPAPRPAPERHGPPAPVSQAPERITPQPVASAPAPAQAPAAIPEPVARVVTAGSRMGMSLTTRLCTSTALVGDKASATLSSAVVGSNGALIPAGSPVVLEVSSVNVADPVESSHIDFRVRSIEVNGEPLPASGDVAAMGSVEKVQASSGNDAAKVAGGAVAGAVLGRIFGRSTKATVVGAAAGAAGGAVAAKRSQTTDACLPSGSALRLTLSRDIILH